MMWLKKEQPKDRGNNEKVDFQDLPSLLTIDQVSEILKVHPNTLRNWDRSGRLKAVRIGPRKDRRYEKLSVKKFYKELRPGQIIKDFPKELEQKKLPPPEEEKYIIKPGLSLEKIRLLLLSKRFSVFVYSVAMVAFTFLTLQVTFFAYLYMVQAEEKPPQAIFATIEPVSATGWENTGKGKHIDALSSSSLSDFDQKISAVYSNKPVTGEEGEEVVIEEGVLAEINPVFEAYDYILAGKIPASAVLKDVKVIFSMAADSFEGNEDVITLELSLDYGKTWEVLDSFALFDDASNVTNEGYWEYPITDKVGKVGDLENIWTRVKYNSVPGAQESIAYLDGVAIKVEAEGPDPTTAQMHESVVLKKKDVTASESPVIEVNTKDKGFLGVGTKKRTIKDFTVTDADGNEVKVEYELTEKEEKGKVISGYEIDAESFEKPGRYSIAMEVEQDGQIEEIKKEFTWGTLVLNTDQHVYKTGQTARFSLGAFVSLENGGIEASEDCPLKGVAYEQADYEVSYIPGVAGQYVAELKAIYQGSTQSILRSFSAEITPSITIKRHGPTRVNPNEYHTMSLEIVSDSDFSGEIRERVPDGFKYAGSESKYCFLENVNDSAGESTGYMEIVCTVYIKQDASNFFTYHFIPLSPETTYFDFGPTVIKGSNGDFNSRHKWDVFLKEGKVEKEVLDKLAAGESPNIISKLRTAEKTINIDQRDFRQEEKTAEYASGIVTAKGLDQLMASTDVESISVDQPVSVLLDEAIPLINASPEDRPDGQTGIGKKICVIDTGVDYDHPAITNYTLGYDFVNNDDDPFDDHGHGTQIAGVVSAIASGSDMYMAKVVDDQGVGYESTVLAGLQWCIDQNVDIINFSIGSGSYSGFCDSNPVAELVNQAVEQGIFISAATGNDGGDEIKAPSCASLATRVSATDKNDTIADFANVNLTVDLFAPGSEVTVPALGGDFISSSGTSISAPMVAAGGALVLENENLSPSDLKYRLRSTGQPIEYTQGDTTINISRMDVYNALINEITNEPYDYKVEQTPEGTTELFQPLSGVGTSCLQKGDPGCDEHLACSAANTCQDCDYDSTACGQCCKTTGDSCLVVGKCVSGLLCNSYTWNAGEGCCEGDDDPEDCGAGDPNGTSCTTGSTCASTYCVDTDATCGGSATCQDPGSTYDGFCCSDGATTWSGDGIITRSSAGAWDCDKTESSLYLSDYYSDCDQSSGNGEQCDSNSLAGGYSVDGACAGTSSCCNTGGGNYPYGASKTDTIPDDSCAADPTDGRTCDHDTSDGSISLTGITTATNDCCNGSTYFSIGSSVTDSTPWETCTTTCTNSRTCYDLGNIGSGLADSEAGVCTADTVCSTGVVSLNATDYVDGCATQDLACDDDVTTAGYVRTGYCCATSCYVDGSRLETESCCRDENCEAYTECVAGTCTATGINLSGIAYQEDESTAIDGTAVNKTVTLLVNGAATACGGGACTDEITDNTGAWAISTITAVSGDIITVYLDNETEEGTTVFVSDGTNQTNVSIFRNAVIVRHDTGASITNANLATGDGGDDDIKYIVATNNLTVDSGFELHVWTGDTYDPGGTVTTNATGGDFHIDDSATAYIDTDSSTIGLDILVDDSATLNIDGSVTVSGGDITTSGTSATITTTTGTPTVTLSGTGSIGGGTTPSIAFYNLTLSGTPTFASDFSVGNNLTLPASVTAGSTTVTMTGTSGTLVGGGSTINNLTIDPSSAGTVTLQTSNLTVSGLLTVAAGDTLSIASGRTLLNTGSSDVVGGDTSTISGAGKLEFTDASGGPGTTITTLSSVVRFDGSSSDITAATFDARTYGGAVELFTSTDFTVFSLASGTVTFESSLEATTSGINVYLTFNSSDPTVTINGNLTIGANTHLLASDINPLTLKGDVMFTAFTHNGGSVILAGDSTQALSGSLGFYDLTITNTYGSVSDCATSFTPGVDFNAAATISGAYTITTGGVKVEYEDSAAYTVGAGGSINWNGGGTDIIFRNSNLGSGTWSLNVDASATQTAVSYVNVARSDASAGSTILASHSTNTDCLNNVNWK